MTAEAMWHDIGVAYVAIPLKCGWTSFKARFPRARPVPRRELIGSHDPRPRYLAVRPPVQRFASLWRYIQATEAKGFIAEHGLAGVTPEALMTYIELHEDANAHWLRQFAYWMPGATPVAHDDLLAALNAPRLNATSYMHTPALPLERINAHYATDADLWRTRVKILQLKGSRSRGNR